MESIKQIIREEFNNFIDNTSKLIIEGLSEPIPVNLNKKNNGYIGGFNIEDNHYEITIEESSPNCYVFKFTRDDSYELSNNIKKAFQVIPTIKKVAEDFIKQNKPNMFSFFLTDGSSGRDKMYSKFTKEISEKYNYSKNIKNYGDGLKTCILFNEYVKDEDFLTLIKFVDNYR